VSATATTQGGGTAYGQSYGLLPTGGANPVGDNFGLVVQLQLMF